MGLFGKKKDKEEELVNGSGLVESVNRENPELQDLLNEFKEMRNNIGAEYHAEDEEIVDEEEVEEGEEYRVSEEESDSIESFLNGEEIEEEIIQDEEILEEEVVEDLIDEEILDEDLEDDSHLDNEIDDADFEDNEELNEEPLDEVIEEPIDVQVNIAEVEDIEPSREEDLIEESSNVPEDVVTSEEIDKKFDEFEKRLLDKIMQQLANVQVAGQVAVSNDTKTDSQNVTMEDDELNIKTVNGKLVINGFTFSGEVVMFTPLESVRKASWEEVVRRKGHCTYHLTTSGNGGWFIKKSNAPNPYAYIEKKEEAEELAKVYAMREKAELKIHNAKGVIEKSLSFGREKLRG